MQWGGFEDGMRKRKCRKTNKGRGWAIGGGGPEATWELKKIDEQQISPERFCTPSIILPTRKNGVVKKGKKKRWFAFLKNRDRKKKKAPEAES